MKTIYIDFEYKCHVTDDGTMAAIETDFFDGKCDAFIEGYRFVPEGKSWTREDGTAFHGEMISPWIDFRKLDVAQREYEQELLEQYKMELAELDSLVLDMQYQNLVEGL